MPAYRLANQAEADLRSIAHFTLRVWGGKQARKYAGELRECFQLLAQSPSIGRRSDSLYPGMRRFEVGKHVVFYLHTVDEVLIVRVLHQQMVPTKARFRA